MNIDYYIKHFLSTIIQKFFLLYFRGVDSKQIANQPSAIKYIQIKKGFSKACKRAIITS